jgi:CheY-like chemotaxis protein
MKLRILAVDADPSALALFTSVVSPLGFEVLAVTEGQRAAERLAREKFDLVALAADMPGLDGFALARRVRASPSNQGVPILLFIAAGATEAMRRGFELGVTFYLEKPLDAEKLRGLFAAARGLLLQQRRRYIRLPIRVGVRCLDDETEFLTRSVDLSQGGILLEDSGTMNAGDRVLVEFSLPGIRDPLRLTGKVVRTLRGGGMAVQFDEPEQLERAALQVFVVGQTPK